MGSGGLCSVQGGRWGLGGPALGCRGAHGVWGALQCAGEQVGLLVGPTSPALFVDFAVLTLLALFACAHHK